MQWLKLNNQRFVELTLKSFSDCKNLYFLSVVQGERPMNYSSCCGCSCWFLFKNSRNLSLLLSSIYHSTYLCQPTCANLPTPNYLCQPTYPYQPKSTYVHTYINTPTHLCLLTNTYQPMSTYHHLPTYLYQSLNINIESPQTQEPVLVLLLHTLLSFLLDAMTEAKKLEVCETCTEDLSISWKFVYFSCSQG